jgi:hypothetical protein
MKKPCRKPAGLSPPPGERYQVQVMRPFADDEQVLAVSECVAAAVQLAGGPVTAVAVTVTFCEGEKPCADPLPEKYTPELSAAYDSS